MQQVSALEKELMAEKERAAEVREVVKEVEVVKQIVVEVVKEVESPARKSLEAELLSARERSAAEQSRAQQLEQRLLCMQDEEAAMRLAHQQRMGELQADALRLRQQLEHQQAEPPDGRLQSALTETTALRERVAQQEQAYSALSSAMEEKEKALLRLQDDKSSVDTELAHVKATGEALSATKATLEASNASLHQANARLENELALLKTNFDAAAAVKTASKGDAGGARVRYSDPVDSWSQAHPEIGSTEDSLYTRLRDYEKRLSKVCCLCAASLHVLCRAEGCLCVCARTRVCASA